MTSENVQVNFGKASALYHDDDLSLLDFGTLINALENAPSVPATASFRLQWNMLAVSDKKRTRVRDAGKGFAGDFWESESSGAAELEWSATESGFSFVSDPASTSSSYYAELGHER